MGKQDGQLREIDEDTLFDGAVCCRQHTRGYRISVDALLAAHFAEPVHGEVVLDLGAGCGIISLVLMYRWRQRIDHLIAYEYQSQLCQLIKENFSRNGYSSQCTCIQGDVHDIVRRVGAETFSLAICNPPYYQSGNGRESLDEESRIARHQVTATIKDFARGAAAAVKNGGSAVFIYPAERITELMAALSSARLEAKKLQLVYSYPGQGGAARLALVRCVKNGGIGCTVLPPLYIYAERNGPYSPEMEKLYEPL